MTKLPVPGRWRALAGMCTAAGLVWLAFADFGVAVPTISRDLGGSLTSLQWANNAFALVTGGLVLAAGKLSDLRGRRRMLEVGLVVFGAVSLATAFVPGVDSLIAGRALMGVGAALILPATLALIPPLFPRSEQPTAFGIWMAVAWVGQAAGPAIGGVLTSALGWRSMFWLSAPLAGIAMIVVHRAAAESKDASLAPGIDVVGVVSSALAAFALLYGCTEGQERGFTDPLVLASLLACVLLVSFFVVSQRRSNNPLIDLQLFAARDFDGALLANTVMNAVFAGLSFLLTLYLQQVKGYSPVEAGLLLVPSTVTILAFNPVGARVARRIGARAPVVGGIAALGIGTVVCGFVGRDYHYWLLAAGLLVAGAGLGLLSTPLSDTAVAGPPEELAGTASGVFKMTSMIGGAFGVAVFVAISGGFQSGDASDRALEAGLSEQDTEILRNAISESDLASSVLDPLPDAEADEVEKEFELALADGAGAAIKVAGGVGLVAVPVLLVLWPGQRRAARFHRPHPPQDLL